MYTEDILFLCSKMKGTDVWAEFSIRISAAIVEVQVPP
jgi:hypothetical protein